ncbi:hypothetical protein MVEN_00589600 [Mycena venus]|uniref:Uncharacterized protein n=1 Tax=Mycena venus TaxID=2733690 RepID=A0A8H7D4X9_9AGAR|nr:hypothetical protein MVEN_00589600 [Mycena venus]
MAQTPTSILPSESEPANPKQKRVKDKQRTKLIHELFQITDSPTNEQYDELVARIKILPGSGNSTYDRPAARRAFGKLRAARNASKAKKAEPIINPKYPTLTHEHINVLNILFENTTAETRKTLHDTWLKSGSFETAAQDDVHAWIQEREQELASNLSTSNNASASTPASTAPATASTSTSARQRNLHIDTNPDVRTHGAEYSASAGLPTPSDTTSPEPYLYPPPFSAASASSAQSSNGAQRWGSSAANARYHPYLPQNTAYTYRPPTPASSSRGASLAPLKSESPLIARLASLPPSASASNSPLVSARGSLPPGASYGSTSASTSAANSPLVPPRASLPPVSASHYAASPPPPTSSSLYSSFSASTSASTPDLDMIPTPPPSALTLPSSSAHPRSSPTPPPPTPPPVEPDYGTRVLVAVHDMLEDPESKLMGTIPTSWPDFQEKFTKFEGDMLKILENLKNINYDPPPQHTPSQDDDIPLNDAL